MYGSRFRLLRWCLVATRTSDEMRLLVRIQTYVLVVAGKGVTLRGKAARDYVYFPSSRVGQ